MRLVREVRCLIASPSDVAEDREAVRKALQLWNAHAGLQAGVRVEPVGWETHSIPESGQHPQAAIIRQIADDCDMCIALFWSKLGSPTPGYESGTVEEVERAIARGQPVLVYFCDRSLPRNTDARQLGALREYQESIRDRVKWGNFESPDNLIVQVSNHLSSVVGPRFKDADIAKPEREVLTAPYPDIRISIGVFHISPRDHGDPKQLIRLSAMNWSPIKFFPATVAARCATDGQNWLVPRDAITGRSPTDFVVEPGNSFDFMMNGDLILKDHRERPNFPDAMFATAFTLYDKAGREYTPDPKDQEAMWRQLIKE